MDAKGWIDAGDYTCIGLMGENPRFALRGMGIKPLVLLYDTAPELLRGVDLYDKVIGKAAATVAVLAGVRSVWGRTMSDAAVAYLENRGIPCSCGDRVPYITNRTGDGMCPLEATALPLEDPEEGYRALKARIALLMAGK